jgi:hypothetical protein
LYAARQLAVPEVKAKGLLAMVHELPDGGGIEITALNFGRDAVDEVIVVPQAKAGASVTDALQPSGSTAPVSSDGGVRVQLKAYEGKALVIKP